MADDCFKSQSLICPNFPFNLETSNLFVYILSNFINYRIILKEISNQLLSYL